MSLSWPSPVASASGDHPLYDPLWETLGGEVLGPCYRMPTVPRSKDLSEVSAKHRRRARIRQEAKLAIYETLCQAFAAWTGVRAPATAHP